MITAREARELAQSSEAAIKLVTDQIDLKITGAASLGKYTLDLDEAMSYDNRFEPLSRAFHSPEFTPWQRLVKQELESAGYSVSIKSKTVTIGGGLGSMEEEGRDEERPYIHVSW
jgi:hypothetical protein